MPIVPDFPDAGRDAEDRNDRDQNDDRDRGAARLSGPLFRDEIPQEPMPTPPPHVRAAAEEAGLP